MNKTFIAGLYLASIGIAVFGLYKLFTPEKSKPVKENIPVEPVPPVETEILN